MLNSCAYVAASRGVRVAPPPPTMTGSGDCTGLGSAGLSTSGVVLAREAERPVGGPQPGDDLQLLLEAVEALCQRREGDAVRLVLAGVPAGAEPELDPAAAHLVDLRDGDRERPGQPEGARR